MNIKSIIFILKIFAILINSYPSIAKNNYNNQRNTYNSSIPSYKPPYAENGSYRGQYSPRTYRQKDVYVQSYKDKHGRKVRNHYRSRKR